MQEFPISNAEAVDIKIGNSEFIPAHINIVDNVVSFIVTDEMQKALTSGEYKATIAYRKVSATSPHPHPLGTLRKKTNQHSSW